MNINQKAQELAKLIKTTDEFKTMNRYKREIEKNKKGGFVLYQHGIFDD